MSWTWKVKMFFDRNLNNFLCISEPNYWILKRHMICASVDSYYRSSWIDIIQPKLACICRHVLPIHDYVSQLWYRCGIFAFCLLSFPQNERKIYKLRQLSFVKVNIDGSLLKKYTKWDKLSCLNLYIFLSFWGNERRQKAKYSAP